MITRARRYLRRAPALLRTTPSFLFNYIRIQQSSATLLARAATAALQGNRSNLRAFNSCTSGSSAAVAGKRSSVIIRSGGLSAPNLRTFVCPFHASAEARWKRSPAWVAAVVSLTLLAVFKNLRLLFAAAKPECDDRELWLRRPRNFSSPKPFAGETLIGRIRFRPEASTTWKLLSTNTRSTTTMSAHFSDASRAFTAPRKPLFLFLGDIFRMPGIVVSEPIGIQNNCGRLNGSTASVRPTPADRTPSFEICGKRRTMVLSGPNFASVSPQVVYLSFLLYGSFAWDSVIRDNKSAVTLHRGDGRLSGSVARDFAAVVEMQTFHLDTMARILKRLADTAVGQYLRVERRGCELRVIFPLGFAVAAVKDTLLGAGIEPDSPHFTLECSLLADEMPTRQKPRYDLSALECSSRMEDEPWGYRHGIEEFLSSTDRFRSGRSLSSFSSPGWTTVAKALKELGKAEVYTSCITCANPSS